MTQKYKKLLENFYKSGKRRVTHKETDFFGSFFVFGHEIMILKLYSSPVKCHTN